MGRIGKGTKVWDEKGLWGDHEIGEDCEAKEFQSPPFSVSCSVTLSVRNPLLVRSPGTAQTRAQRSNRSAERR